MKIYPHLKPLLFKIDPETAHRAAIRALAAGIVPSQPILAHGPLHTRVSGVDFRHPVCLAAGFDKNAEAAVPLFAQGFAAVECGTVTPRPQAGNPKPRMFRLVEDEAVINRLGFNNEGLEALRRRLQTAHGKLAQVRSRGGVLGINIGKNKDSEDAVADYVTMLQGVAEYADYVTVNISSPNTPGLRDMQAGSALSELLDAVCAARDKLSARVPLWLKVAPDLTDEQVGAMVETLRAYPLDALIISNTTISRPTLKSESQNEQGGLSGKPLFALSTDRLKLFHRLTEGRIPLVGVGGIASAEDAYAKIRAGASLVQLYSALAYQGFALVTDIRRGLAAALERDGFAHVSEAVGIDAKSVS